MRSCLVCDDHAMMRAALAGAVSLAWPDAQVATAEDYPAGWAIAGDLRPDLILCDLMMPGSDPVEGIATLRAIAPDARIVVITGSADDAMLIALLEMGIHGFVTKNVGAEIVEAAMRLVMAGGRYVPDRVIELASTRARNGAAPPIRLSERQSEVLTLMAQGRSNKEIARSLGLAPATIKAHTATILATLDTGNRTEAAFKARELGLI